MRGRFWGAFLLGCAALVGLDPGDGRADRPRVRHTPAAAERTGAEVRGSRVYVGERLVYRGQPRERLISGISWSVPRDAIAFATRERGLVKLVVVLVAGGAAGHVMRWPVPAHREVGTRASVTWLGPRRVALGRDRLAPSVVASWKLSR